MTTLHRIPFPSLWQMFAVRPTRAGEFPMGERDPLTPVRRSPWEGAVLPSGGEEFIKLD